ncbi:uncharacterized protein LOC143151800 [Ptiloglossa arizonensis]|uniref:uncharacterized protein LOC143151800 n=1 Tax=Ptiloglossa arizonensis TaxID=3350558 RepID=UPI003FA13203
MTRQVLIAAEFSSTAATTSRHPSQIESLLEGDNLPLGLPLGYSSVVFKDLSPGTASSLSPEAASSRPEAIRDLDKCGEASSRRVSFIDRATGYRSFGYSPGRVGCVVQKILGN